MSDYDRPGDAAGGTHVCLRFGLVPDNWLFKELLENFGKTVEKIELESGISM